jgi:RNA polymerase sigma-70 factor (ECF subfamily)
MATALMTAPPPTPAEPGTAGSRPWVEDLRSEGARGRAAVAELHALLLKGARFEIGRRAPELSHLRGGDQEDLAQQAADDALMAVLRKLDQFRGESRFTTWAYKFALLEAAVKVRRRAWQGREIPLEEEAWSAFADAGAPAGRGVEDAELFAALREELVAVALNGVPIDVLAERLDSTRGALYKNLHDARRNLRAALAARGFRVVTGGEEKP